MFFCSCLIFDFLFKMIPTFTCDRRKMGTMKISVGPPGGRVFRRTFMIGIIWATRKS